MKSQELVHIHALLLELRMFLERDGAAPAGAFDAYEAQPVRPTHIHRPKTAHERAIGLLLDGLDQSVRTHPPPDQAPIS
ncbi:UPF0058 family protein [Haloarchaeobius amylolyticus]|uniref:UPF0058 family protein n=1 Tax=Haloarchaeobius amylolyticus TaxID=1198296 RepID=A0ABD6BGI9_9EURY